MISVWLLFQALWQWVGENRLHYYSFAVLQYAVTVLVHTVGTNLIVLVLLKEGWIVRLLILCCSAVKFTSQKSSSEFVDIFFIH